MTCPRPRRRPGARGARIAGVGLVAATGAVAIGPRPPVPRHRGRGGAGRRSTAPAPPTSAWPCSSGRPMARPTGSTSTTRRPAHPTGSAATRAARSTSPAPRPSSLAPAGRRPTATRLPVRARRRRRGGGHVQRQGPTGARSTTSTCRGGTIAKIFMGYISQLERPGHHRRQHAASCCPTSRSTSSTAAGQSGTTGLFYDFVAAHRTRACSRRGPRRNRLPTSVRIIQLDSAPDFAPKTQALRRLGPDRPVRGQRRRHVDRSPTTSSATPRPTAPRPAWVDNGGRQVGAALRREHLRRARARPAAAGPEPGALRRVHQPRTRRAYPISAYSYIVTQCAPSADRPTCKGNYSNAGVTATLAEVAALHRLRRADRDGRDRLLAAAAEPLAGDRQLDRPHERDRRRSG